MATDPTTGTQTTTVGDAAATQTTGTVAADGGNAGQAAETPEQLRERIAKLEQEKAQHLAEKSNAEANARRIAELEMQRAEPRTTTVDPLAMNAAEQERYAAVLRDDPNNYEYRRLLRAAQQDGQALQWEQAKRMVEPQLASISDATLQAKTREAFASGQFGSVEAAKLAAMGLLSQDTATKDAAREVERRKQDEAARAKGADRPSTATGEGAATSPAGLKEMLQTDYERMVAAGGAAAHKLVAERDAGQIKLK